MLRTQFEKNNDNDNDNNFIDKYLYASDYIYNNYDKFITNIDIKNYIDNSSNMILKYQQIWSNLDYKRVVANYIALNLFILCDL